MNAIAVMEIQPFLWGIVSRLVFLFGFFFIFFGLIGICLLIPEKKWPSLPRLVGVFFELLLILGAALIALIVPGVARIYIDSLTITQVSKQLTEQEVSAVKRYLAGEQLLADQVWWKPSRRSHKQVLWEQTLSNLEIGSPSEYGAIAQKLDHPKWQYVATAL